MIVHGKKYITFCSGDSTPSNRVGYWSKFPFGVNGKMVTIWTEDYGEKRRWVQTRNWCTITVYELISEEEFIQKCNNNDNNQKVNKMGID